MMSIFFAKDAKIISALPRRLSVDMSSVGPASSNTCFTLISVQSAKDH